MISNNIELGKRRPREAGARVVMPDGSLKPLDALFPMNSGGYGSGFSGADNSANRGYVIFPTLDTRREITKWSRTEMLRRSRWLYDNFGFHKGVVCGVSRMMGSLHPAPKTDRAWKKAALNYFWSYANSPLLFSRPGKYNFNSFQRFVSRRWLIDGDLANVFARGRTGATMVSPFEAHQIAHNRNDDNGWFDGVQVDSGNRLRQISIADPDNDSFTKFGANEALLTAYWERAGQPRGVTPFHAAITRMMDIREVTSDMMAGVKRSNLIGFYLHSPDSKTQMLGADGLAGGLQDHISEMAGLNGAPVEKKVKIEDLTGSGAIPEMPGFEPKVLHDARPPSQQMDLLKWFVRECSLSLDYPPEILWDLGALNGNTSRLMKERAESTNQHYRDEILKPFCQRYWWHLIGGAIATGKLPEPETGRWDAVDWVAPRKMTIDRGNDGKLNLDERRQPGMRTLSTHYGELQKSWESEADQWLDEIDYFMDSARSRGWDEARIAGLQAQLLAAPQGAATISPADISVPSQDEKVKA